jgi:hypothetical protein
MMPFPPIPPKLPRRKTGQVRGHKTAKLVGGALLGAMQQVAGYTDADRELDAEIAERKRLDLVAAEKRKEEEEFAKLVIEYDDQMNSYLANFPFREVDSDKRLHAKRQICASMHRVYGKKLHLVPKVVHDDFNEAYEKHWLVYLSSVRLVLEETERIHAARDALADPLESDDYIPKGKWTFWSVLDFIIRIILTCLFAIILVFIGFMTLSLTTYEGRRNLFFNRVNLLSHIVAFGFLFRWIYILFWKEIRDVGLGGYNKVRESLRPHWDVSKRERSVINRFAGSPVSQL